MRFIPGDYNNFSITAQRFNLTLGVQRDFRLRGFGIPNLGTLTADWAEVAAEIAVAVVAMLHLALMPVSIVRNGLLPLAETLVIFF